MRLFQGVGRLLDFPRGRPIHLRLGTIALVEIGGRLTVSGYVFATRRFAVVLVSSHAHLRPSNAGASWRRVPKRSPVSSRSSRRTSRSNVSLLAGILQYLAGLLTSLDVRTIGVCLVRPKLQSNVCFPFLRYHLAIPTSREPQLRGDQRRTRCSCGGWHS